MKILYLLIAFTIIFVNVSPDDRFLQSSAAVGDVSLPPGTFDISNLFNIYYEFQPPGFITMALKFNIPGQYFSIGFGTVMVGSDMWVFELINNEVQVTDRYGLSYDAPPLDTDLGGTEDVERLGYEITPSYTLVKVRRALDTGDPYDIALTEGPVSGIYATGPAPTMVYHGDADGITIFPFAPTTAAVVTPQPQKSSKTTKRKKLVCRRS